MAVINVKCIEAFKNKVKEFSKDKGETSSAIIRKALHSYMNDNAKKVQK